MFTGIIQSTAKVASVSDRPGLRRLVIAAQLNDVKLGDSIAINGACLTAADLGRDFENLDGDVTRAQAAGKVGFDVIQETLDKTNLGLLHAGDDVNLEQSLRACDRIDGHFVQGHVDGTGVLARIDNQAEYRLTIEAPVDMAKYLAPKGSISIDGVSLTIAAVRGIVFEVALIPTTLKLTTLGCRAISWRFNLEADILSKTVVHYLEQFQK